MSDYRRTGRTEHCPPTRLCLCGHNFSVHSRGFCGVVAGCGCGKFREDFQVPKLLPDSNWMGRLYGGDFHVFHAKGPA